MREHMLFAYRHLMRAVRDERYKLIEYVLNGARVTQLYDLQEDPWETVDLSWSPDHHEVLVRLRRKLAAWRDEWGDTQPGMGKVFWGEYGSH